MTTRWFAVMIAGVAMIGAAACGGDAGDDDDSGAMAQGGTSASGAAYEASGESVAPPRSVIDGLGGNDGAPLGSVLDRKIVVNGTLSLEVPDVAGAFSEAGRLARNAGGFVEESRLTARTGDDGKDKPYGMIVLRVPSDQYDRLVTALQAIDSAEVVSEGVTSQEVTEEYTDLQSRLRNLERSEAQYLDLLAKATTIEEIITVTDRVDGVRAQIEQVQGRINLLDSLTAYASISVTLAPIPPANAPGSGNGPAAVFADAWEWSLEVAGGVGVAAAYLLVAAAWLAVPAAAAGGVLVMARRRRASAAGTPV